MARAVKGPLEAAVSPRVPAPGGAARLGHLGTGDTSVLHMSEAEPRTCGLGRVILMIFISRS